MPSNTRFIKAYTVIPATSALSNSVLQLRRDVKTFYVVWFDKVSASYKVYGTFRSLRQAFKYGFEPLLGQTSDAGGLIPLAPEQYIVFSRGPGANQWFYANLGANPT